MRPELLKRFAYLTAALFTTALVLGSAPHARADVTLPDVLSGSMVLQRGVRVPVWGSASPGEAVAVSFAGQTKRTTAGDDGRWRVWLDPLKANATPATLTVSGRNRVELKDVLVGEVWLVSGQSNMQFTLAETREAAAAIAGANHPNIRLFNVSRQVAFKHRPPPLATWRAATPESVKDFSAAGFYFAFEIQKELGVPVGIINSSYGGSQAEAWTPSEYLARQRRPQGDGRAHEDLGRGATAREGRVRGADKTLARGGRQGEGGRRASLALAARAGRAARVSRRLLHLRRHDRAAHPLPRPRRLLVSGRVERGARASSTGYFCRR